jgi:hypothetical protein
MRCISAICPAGPPNLMQPIFSHTRSGLASGHGAAAFRAG